MKLHQLEIIESVARHLNITSASNELHMSQPAVSSQLKLLEQEYGTKFFSRSSRGVALTDNGRAFVNAVRPLLAETKKVELQFKAYKPLKRPGRLTVAANNTLSATVLPRAIAEFRERNPDVQLVVEVFHSLMIERAILASDVEVALITRPSHSEDFVYEPFQQHGTVAFVPNDSVLGDRLANLEELIKHPLVVKKHCPVVRELQRRGFELEIALQCSERESVKAAVKRGLGVGMLFATPVESDISEGDMRIIDVPELSEIKHDSFIVYGRHKLLSPAGQCFIETLHRMRAAGC